MENRPASCQPDAGDTHFQLDSAIPDSRTVDISLRASLMIALRVYNSQILEGQLSHHITQAMSARNVGEVRRIVASVDRLLHG